MKKISFLLLFCLCFNAPVLALAKKSVVSGKKPMPKFERLTPERLDDITEWHEEIPFNNKSLAYKVRIPKGWIKAEGGNSENSDINKKVFDEVARFYSPPRLDKRSVIRIQAIQLEYKLSAEQWLTKFLLSQGYAIESFESYGENRAEAFVVHVIKDTQNAVRTVAQINGKQVLLLQYFLPITHWEDERQVQMEVLKSLAPLNPVTELVEPMLSFQFLDIAEFKYPESWELKSKPVRSVDRMGVELFNVASKKKVKKKTITAIDGKIDIKLVSLFAAQNLQEEIDRQKAEFEESGLQLKEIIELYDDFKTSVEFQFAAVDVYEAVDQSDKLIDYELWFGTFVQGEYLYFVSLLTPSRTDDYFVWARNTQTYRTVIELLKPQKKTKQKL